MGKQIIGGKNGNLVCRKCGDLRFPGKDLCPKCFWGDDFNPVLHAQAVARSEAIKRGDIDPSDRHRLICAALSYARWLVNQGYCGWGLAYAKAARKHGVTETEIRRVGADRSANSRLMR